MSRSTVAIRVFILSMVLGLGVLAMFILTDLRQPHRQASRGAMPARQVSQPRIVADEPEPTEPTAGYVPASEVDVPPPPDPSMLPRQAGLSQR
jgi:hypothetical protein